jgi:hypothetical protein
MPGARVKFGILVSYLALAACLFDKLRSPGTVSSVLSSHDDCFEIFNEGN